MRARLLAALIALAALAAPAVAGAAPQWRFEHPNFGNPGVLTELGRPGDLQFRPGSSSRALLAIEGNATFPRRGLFTWDGRAWTPLSEVCGAAAENARVAWAGPAEFWTIAQPSPPRGGPGQVLGPGDGLAVCHFRGGEVVGSYSRARGDADPYFALEAAACAGPSSCWFAGVGARDPSGTRLGGFHLRWDGASLSTVYAPQGRGVTDVAPLGGGFVETLRVGPGTTEGTLHLAEPEPVPALLHTIGPAGFENVDWFPNRDRDFDSVPEVPVEATDLYALDVDGGEAWAVGGGTGRGPIAVRYSNGEWREAPIAPSAFGAEETFADVAAIPGSDDAWVAVQSRDQSLTSSRAKVSRIAPDGTVVEQYLSQSGSGIPTFHGAAAKLDCASQAQCWMATYRGILYHYGDPASPPPQDVDPAFAETIVDRPNEAVSQVIPDELPEDDSELFKPPPIELPAEPGPGRRPKPCPVRPALIEVLDSGVLGVRKLKLRVEIKLRRTARVALVGYRGKRKVARTPMRKLRRGRHTLTMAVSRELFPKRLSFKTRELTRSKCGRRGGR